MPSTEKPLQKMILQYLELNRIFHYRNNSGAFKTADGHFYRFGANGSPDIIAVINGLYVGIECKDKYAKQSPSQKGFQTRLEAAGGKYACVREFGEAQAFIESVAKGNLLLA